jgi:hypothetical protein
VARWKGAGKGCSLRRTLAPLQEHAEDENRDANVKGERPYHDRASANTLAKEPEMVPGAARNDCHHESSAGTPIAVEAKVLPKPVCIGPTKVLRATPTRVGCR